MPSIPETLVDSHGPAMSLGCRVGAWTCSCAAVKNKLIERKSMKCSEPIDAPGRLPEFPFFRPDAQCTLDRLRMQCPSSVLASGFANTQAHVYASPKAKILPHQAAEQLEKRHRQALLPLTRKRAEQQSQERISVFDVITPAARYRTRESS
jgi:hypothetical protein